MTAPKKLIWELLISTHCGLVIPYGELVTQIWVNIGSGNGLVSDGTKPFTWTNLNLSLMRFYGIHIRAISRWVAKLLFCIKSLKIIASKCLPYLPGANGLTHWGRVMHICVGKPTIIGSDNGLSPGRRQAIIWTNAGILLISSSRTNFNEILIKIHTFSFKKIHLKMSSAKRRLFRLGLNVLSKHIQYPRNHTQGWASVVVLSKSQDYIRLFWPTLPWQGSRVATRWDSVNDWQTWQNSLSLRKDQSRLASFESWNRVQFGRGASQI